MFTPIRMEIPTIAVAKARARITKSGHAYTPEKTKSFEAELRWHWQKLGREMVPKCATALTIGIFLPMPKSKKKNSGDVLPCCRPDVDNFAKAVLDALNKFAWHDDGQVTDLTVYKRYAPATPYILITIHPVIAA